MAAKVPSTQSPIHSYPESIIRRVNIRQLLQANQASSAALFEIEGHEVKTVMLVANIFNIDVRVDRINFELDDSTGTLRAFQPTATWPPGVRPPDHFAYIQAVGELNKYRTFKVSHLRPVPDPHTIYSHTLAVITETLIFERGPPPQLGDIILQSPSGRRLGVHDAPLFDESSWGPTQIIADRTIEPPGEAAVVAQGSVIGDTTPYPQGTELDLVTTPANVEQSTSSSPHALVSQGSNIQEDIATITNELGNTYVSNPLLPKSPRSRDPYSHLSSMKRSIILCITNAVYDRDGPFFWSPDPRSRSSWVGVPLKVILEAAQAQTLDGRLNPVEFQTSMAELVEDGFICTPYHDAYYAPNSLWTDR
ncbi:hypothetical protein BD779DRAFT_1192102 [Infundibulicybe gibba]|nr:hypothetical protein BD779DRAFT_1192102 [Infundibulicybe gibba]